MKKFIVQCGLASILALSAASAMAGGVNWSVNVGVGGYGYYPPPPVYYSPPPYNNYSNYFAPPVIYGNAVPVYQTPPPVIYAPAPFTVYSYPSRPRHHGHHRDGYERGHREYRDYHR